MLLFSLQDAEMIMQVENARIRPADFPTVFGLSDSENVPRNSIPQH